MDPEQVTILHVEDDLSDVKALKRAFIKHELKNPIVVAENGLDALAHLRGENGKKRLEGPYLVLLDLNMPRMSGHEFLEALREDPCLKWTTVFVLTTSNSSNDRHDAHEQQVAGYIQKSSVTSGQVDLARLLSTYCRIVEIPQPSARPQSDD